MFDEEPVAGAVEAFSGAANEDLSGLSHVRLTLFV